ncbi:sensor histidine kinase [Thalassotalea aquiviva]|uniref:sensor histidine kinase n=1 Tax=Thalassotalea aquiviva TaxID=3242415 RepID=UPI00352B5EB6
MDTFLNPDTLELESNQFSNQSQQFWTLQFVGWIGYSLVVFFAIIHPQFETPGFNLGGQILNLIAEALCGFGLSYIQWQVIGKVVHLPLKKTLAISFFSAALLGFIYNIFKLSFYKVLVYNQQWNQAWDLLEFGGWLMFSITTMFVWTSIYFIMLYNSKLQKGHEMLLLAQNAVKDAQLQMLRYQLNPHFMFNTMNAISTLIYKNENEKANEMLDQMCEFFRYSLDKKTHPYTTLNNEVALLDLYLSIEKVRFGDKLNVVMDIEPGVKHAMIPTMLLQPLVENAVKYAIEPKKTAGVIAISAFKQHNRLHLIVDDDGAQGKNQTRKGFGIGISNTKERLKTMFNGDFEVNIGDSPNNGSRVHISTPMEFNHVEK